MHTARRFRHEDWNRPSTASLRSWSNPAWNLAPPTSSNTTARSRGTAGGLPRDVFVFDDQLHMIRESYNGTLALRALAQGDGAAAHAVGIEKNPFNP